jgi:hypothetical protein
VCYNIYRKKERENKKMKHLFTELYYIHNGKGVRRTATKEYLKANNIPYDLTREEKEAKHWSKEPYAIQLSSRVANSKPFGVLDVNGVKYVYTFGEKLWFDNEEERDEYRRNYNAEMTDLKEKNRLKKQINEILDTMEIQDLEILLAKLS